MRLSLSLLIAPLLASPWVAANNNGCNADNCLRALRNPTRTAAATSFCRTYTQAIITATTALPTQFATPCGSGATQSVRLSSACSCYVPPPSCGNTNTDSNNCGTCGNVCPAGTTCSSGACVCANSGKAPCNGQCPELTSDNSNCGTCGNTCDVGSTCQSGICTPASGGNCSNYTASCSDVVNGILATNSIASPELVDYRLQTALLELTSPADFLAALGADPCASYTDPDENAACRLLLANEELVESITELTIAALTALQSCAADFAAGTPHDQIIVTDPGTCAAPTRRRVRRAGEEHDLTQTILEAIEALQLSAPPPVLGEMKPAAVTRDLLEIIKRQSGSCANVGRCFQTCPSCREQQTTCGPNSVVISTDVCNAVTAVVAAVVGGLAVAPCAAASAACGPLILACEAICVGGLGGLAGVVANGICNRRNNNVCNPLAERCANCNTANGNICNPDSSQCCAGETGTQCGTNGCCCCPRCQAPGGINCACTQADC
ncbi:hypothetical protein V8F06_006674 [Rhypophila decipiens]